MRRVCALCALVVLGGCAKKIVKAPTEAYVTLNGKKATYRDWTRAEVCLVDPAVLAGDLDSMNAVLIDLLSQTSAGPEGMWADEHIATLEAAQKALPVALKIDAANFASMKNAACKIDGLIRAAELNAQATKRLEDAPQLLIQVKGHKAILAWKDAQAALISAAKEKCSTKVKAHAKPEVFYASEDEANHAQWVFCDGSTVVAAPGAPPTFVQTDSPVPKAAKKPKPQDYLDSASKFDSALMNRCPKMPSKITAKKDDGQPEPEETP